MTHRCDTINWRSTPKISQEKLSFSTIVRTDRQTERGRRLTTMNRFRHDNEKRKNPAERRSWLPADGFPWVYGGFFADGRRKVAPSFEELSSYVFSDVAKTRKTCCNGFTADYASRAIRDRIHGNIPIVHGENFRGFFSGKDPCQSMIVI